MSKNRSAYKGLKASDERAAYVFVAPAVILLGIFVIAPLIMAVQKSFTDWTFYGGSAFVGFKNFRMIFQTKYFQVSVFNAIKFVLIIVPLMLAVSFFFASMLMNIGKRSANFVKTSIYIPGIVSGVVASVIMLFVLQYQKGLANQFVVEILNLKKIPWLTEPFWATAWIVITSIWLGLGGNTILMYAALANVPPEFYEAASIDGAGALKKMIYITIPQIRNIIVLITIGLSTGTLQLFELPLMMTGGGPLNSTLTPMLYLFNNFKDFNKTMGYTIAGALFMMIVIAAINSVVFLIIRSEKSIVD